ncbi:DUF5709 domain-containing protein [Streptomyces aidingensis]|uniref:DUF5709 domain-containing protein n=1 Tax=Streptomyces aidingensis TaxID=910347 RepID=A0A1I1SH83_9ACTN|nr:DUF5709 domain-containing protein [Streptomyces aidingensis]SFD45806.1 hypothetical protein SAMN05421773_11629 [Streptomyces aidingensis]
MSDEETEGDEVYQPQMEDVPDDAGPLETKDTLVQRGSEPIEEGYSPPERPFAVDDWGTTAREQREGEGLERRLSRELPEPDTAPDDGIGDLPDGEGEPRDTEVGDARAGRLVGYGGGSAPDTDAELSAADVGIDGGAASAEEAAVHLVEGEETGEERGGTDR